MDLITATLVIIISVLATALIGLMLQQRHERRLAEITGEHPNGGDD